MTRPAQQALHLARPVLFSISTSACSSCRWCARYAFQSVEYGFQWSTTMLQNVFQQAASFRRDAVKYQPDGRRDVQPLRFAANSEAGLIHVFHWRCGHLIAHRGNANPLNRAAQARLMLAMVAVTRFTPNRSAINAARRFSGQQLIVQQIDHDSRDARAVLDRRGHVFGKGGSCLRAARRAQTAVGAMFGHD